MPGEEFHGTPHHPPEVDQDREVGPGGTAAPAHSASQATDNIPENSGVWFARIEAQLSELLHLVQHRLQDDLVKGQLFEKLYHDLTHYRDDFVFKYITQRIFSDVISLFDRVDTVLRDEALAQMHRDDLIDWMRSFRGELLQTLRRQDVLMIDQSPGMFNETFQEAIAARPVPQAEEQKVLEVVRRGFRYRDHLLRPESVVVGKYEAKQEGTTDGQGNRH